MGRSFECGITVFCLARAIKVIASLSSTSLSVTCFELWDVPFLSFPLWFPHSLRSNTLQWKKSQSSNDVDDDTRFSHYSIFSFLTNFVAAPSSTIILAQCLDVQKANGLGVIKLISHFSPAKRELYSLLAEECQWQICKKGSHIFAAKRRDKTVKAFLFLRSSSGVQPSIRQGLGRRLTWIAPQWHGFHRSYATVSRKSCISPVRNSANSCHAL